MGFIDSATARAEELWFDLTGPRGWRSIAGPAAFAVAAMALLVYDHLQERVPSLLFWLTLGLIGSVFGWMLETNRRNAGALAERQRQTLEDPLTGLENRSCLERDIAAAVADPGRRTALILLELDDLQPYNGRFGIAAGDVAVRRVGQTLADWASSASGKAYRIEGGRLAVLAPLGDGQLGELVLAATGTVYARDGDLPLSRVHGEAALPDEARDAQGAIQVAEHRLALHRERQHRSARRQAQAVLVAALAARRPEAPEHMRVAVYRAISISRRLGVPYEELDDIALAAELHDLGLLAVPEAVLEKSGPLDEAERALIRAHPLAGERIIAAAPGLASVAALVRSSSERFDGSGYPDGLSGEAIPMGARVVAVAVAFAGITSPRPHRGAQSEEAALAELRRCAGSQFDPRVVEALAADLSEEAAERPPALA